eukprot:TRINITY_DN5037_c0_g2_i1.p1 TRINITY_DN5037_c0_g2~~TRINITY_DN5037_c0_g2_i1.p1  ORF type:complete len:172 (+),score=2.04 TRINITY_DN5037_c0_g2_i1:282-797(+)
MHTRPPVCIQGYMLGYNVYQIGLNGCTAIALLIEHNRLHSHLWGNEFTNSPDHYTLAFFIWLHYINKYVELLDTLFMILRKRDKQITFLHVYHHILIIWAWFSVSRVGSGTGDAYFGASINSSVHVILYTYYSVTLLGYRVPSIVKMSITSEIGRAVQQECRDRSRMPSSA